MTDGGAITGLDAREDGVYITYKPSAGADAVTKKLGNVAFQNISQGSLSDDTQPKNISVPAGYRWYILILTGSGNGKYFNASGCGATLLSYITATDYGTVYNSISVYLLNAAGTVTCSGAYGRRYLLFGVD